MPEGPLLIVSGVQHKVGQGGDTEMCYQQLEAYVREHFDVKSIEYAWSTHDLGTPDGVPFIGKISPAAQHTYVATGFAGWGMTTGTYAAKLIADLITGKVTTWERFFAPNRLSWDDVPKLAKENANVAKHFVGDRLKTEPTTVPNLKPGEVAVLDDRGAYCDEQDRLHVVSRTCTHMGCLVNWNPAEKTWDCPCHGSRFAYDGSVLYGPAYKALETRPLNKSTGK